MKNLAKPVDLSHHFSEISRCRKQSEIDKDNDEGSRQGLANLAAGLPNPKLFPWRSLECDVLQPRGVSNFSGRASYLPFRRPRALQHLKVPYKSKADERIELATALQYGRVNGYPPLLDLVKRLVFEHIHPTTQYEGGADVILTCGSTDGMSKCLELFTNTWSPSRDHVSQREGILVEEFMYAAVLTQAKPRGLHMAPVAIDTQGMLPGGEGGLKDVLENWDLSRGRRPHLMYTVTIGNNPTGSVLPLERRQEIYDICSQYDILIIEDEPYWFLTYDNTEKGGASYTNAVEPLHHGSPISYTDLDRDGRVVRLDTFSKMMAPGCRMGWITAQPAIIEKFERITECFAGLPSGFVQGIVASMLEERSQAFMESRVPATARINCSAQSRWDVEGLIGWLDYLRNSYQERMLLVCQVLEENCWVVEDHEADSDSLVNVSKTRLFTFERPSGGMFVWLHMKFYTHPLWHSQCPYSGLIRGCMLSKALFKFLKRKPYRIMASSGESFSATEYIRKTKGWQYCRICFAAEDEENLKCSMERFINGLHDFWKIRDHLEMFISLT